MTNGTWATPTTASIPGNGPVPPKNRVTSCIKPETNNHKTNGWTTAETSEKIPK